jgi:hypothetical protein
VDYLKPVLSSEFVDYLKFIRTDKSLKPVRTYEFCKSILVDYLKFIRTSESHMIKLPETEFIRHNIYIYIYIYIFLMN